MNATVDAEQPASNPVRYVEQMSTPNEAITLYEGAARLTLTDVELAGRAKVQVQWLPRARTEIEFDVEQGDVKLAVLYSDGKDAAPLLLTDRSLTLRVKSHGYNYGTAGLRLRLAPAGDTTSIVGNLEANALFFSLLNFEPFYVPNQHRTRATRGAVLESERWRVVVEPLPNANDLYEELKDVGGYALTHGCSVVRKDGGRILPEQARNVLQGLLHFFSFAQGAWAPPLFALALDDTALVWQEWYFRFHERWESGPISWFDQDEGQMLAEVFPGFMARWESELWHDTLRAAIYWYINSNGGSGGADGSLILTQTGLELLAWTHAVEDRRLVTADAFQRLSAADQIRLLLVSLDIPIDLNAHVPRLVKIAKAENWLDVPQALTGIRNALVHGNPKVRQRLAKSGLSETLFEAWNLGLYTYELVLLRLFRYQGLHAQRIDLPQMAGKVCRVPWAAPT